MEKQGLIRSQSHNYLNVLLDNENDSDDENDYEWNQNSSEPLKETKFYIFLYFI